MVKSKEPRTKIQKPEKSSKNQDPRSKKAPSKKFKSLPFGEVLLFFYLRFLIYLDLGSWFLDLSLNKFAVFKEKISNKFIGKARKEFIHKDCSFSVKGQNDCSFLFFDCIEDVMGTFLRGHETSFIEGAFALRQAIFI